MWQRFSERARKVVFYAQEEAQALHHDYVATEHLLLGLLRESDSVAVRIVNMRGISPDRIRAEVKKNVSSGDDKPSPDITLTPNGKKAIYLAYDEARALNNDYIGTEHLLLALIQDAEGVAGRVLKQVGVELDVVREDVQKLQEEYKASKEAQARPAEPTRLIAPPPHRTGGLDLPVRFDLQLLHPVDHITLGILLDGESEFGKQLRQKCPSLDLFLPAIVATMAEQRNAKRSSLAKVLKGELSTEALYKACVKASPPNLRAALADLNLIEPTEADERK